MEKKIKDPKKRIPVEVPYRKHPEIQETEYTFDGEFTGAATKAASSINSFGIPSKNDVLGSYTGTPSNKYETPVQDADDL